MVNKSIPKIPLNTPIIKITFLYKAVIVMLFFRFLDVAHLEQVLDLCLWWYVSSHGYSGGRHLPHHLHGPLPLLRAQLPGNNPFSLPL